MRLSLCKEKTMRKLLSMAAVAALMAAPAFASTLHGGFTGQTSTTAYGDGSTAAAPDYAFADAGETSTVGVTHSYGATTTTTSYSAGSDAGAYGPDSVGSSSTTVKGGFKDNSSVGFGGWGNF